MKYANLYPTIFIRQFSYAKFYKMVAKKKRGLLKKNFTSSIFSLHVGYCFFFFAVESWWIAKKEEDVFGILHDLLGNNFKNEVVWMI